MLGFVRFWSASFVTQLSSRVLSFMANQFLVKLLTPAHFGIWSVRLGLVLETIVYWAREGVRKAASRSKENRHRYALLPLLIGVVAAPIVLAIAARSQPEGVDGFFVACVLTALCAMLELCGEMWAVPQLADMKGGALAQVSSFAFVIRSVTVVTLVYRFYDPDAESTWPLMMCFGVANLGYGAVLVIGFWAKCGKPVVEMPTANEFASLKPFAFQTILQWLFAQGERMILLMSNTPEQVGVYGFVSDLTSLLARVVFAPIESAVFSVCATSEQPPIEILSMCTRLVVYIGLGAAAFGPPIGPRLLRVVYGEKWSGVDAKRTLAAVCRVMPVMTFNGVTEAYANARLTAKRLEIYNILLAIVSVIYFAFMYILSKSFGACGAVYSNGINMSLRSMMAIFVIFSECGRVFSIFPRLLPLLFLTAIAVFGSHIDIRICIALLPVAGLLILVAERHTLQTLRSFVKRD